MALLILMKRSSSLFAKVGLESFYKWIEKQAYSNDWVFQKATKAI